MYTAFMAALVTACIAFTPFAMAQSDPLPGILEQRVELNQRKAEQPSSPKVEQKTKQPSSSKVGRSFPNCESCRDSGCESFGGNACFMSGNGCTCMMGRLQPFR